MVSQKTDWSRERNGEGATESFEKLSARSRPTNSNDYNITLLYLYYNVLWNIAYIYK